MVGIPPNIATLDQRIAAVRENLRELIEQAAAYSGAADDDLASQRIAEQEALLARLVNERDMELVHVEPDSTRTARKNRHMKKICGNSLKAPLQWRQLISSRCSKPTHDCRNACQRPY